MNKVERALAGEEVTPDRMDNLMGIYRECWARYLYERELTTTQHEALIKLGRAAEELLKEIQSGAR